MSRVLILSTTTGYQLRSFGESAERAGIDLIFATDRCHRLDDPWRDAAVPVRFHEEDASLQAIVDAASARPIDGVLAVGDRPVVLAARAARALGLPGNPPEAAAASANKRLARQRLAAAGLPVPWFFDVARADAASAAHDSPRPLPVRRQAAGTVGQPRRHAREFDPPSSMPPSRGSTRCSRARTCARCAAGSRTRS